VLLVGTFPVDLARRGTAAAAVGFVNFMGYMGAAAETSSPVTWRRKWAGSSQCFSGLGAPSRPPP